ncbi:MAG: ATP-binding cassette domain-containing protein [Polyangiaceae bacterium]
MQRIASIGRPSIQLEGLKKSFRRALPRESGIASRVMDLLSPRLQAVQAIADVSFRIEPGERVAFIGPNGAGKSTTLKVLSGILEPDAGTVDVLGMVPWRERTRLAFAIGTVFGQRSQLWYQLPAKDSLELLGHVYELSRSEYQRRLAQLTEAFDLGAILGTPVRQLSLGQRMRCELAASLLHAPRVLFLDEPTIGLDAVAKASIRELLQHRSREEGATLLLTSHDTGDIEKVCERVIVIHGGRVLFDAPIGELKRRYLSLRRVTVSTEKAELELELPGATRVHAEPHRTTYQLDERETSLGRLVDCITRQTSLRDLEIDDPPLEEVVRRLYADADRGAPS